MKKNILIGIILIISSLLAALPISFNMQNVNFGTCIAGTQVTRNLTVYNLSAIPQDIIILHTNRSFSFSDTTLTISGNDSVSVNVLFNGKHNISYNDVAFFTSGNNNPSYLSMTAAPYYSQTLYNSTANLWDSQLKSALYNLINNHNSISYNEAREEMFGNIDNVNGSVECVYTGQVVQTTGIPDNNVMNCEHTWPQSMGAEGTAKSDLYHLYPTNSTANSVRGNLPFGVVVSGQNWAVGGSKRGQDSNGTTVFEPRDLHKGDCARSMFYFCLRYSNPSSPFFNNQEPTLRQWHIFDAVSTKETNRNNAIEEIQETRNPFVDHPEFIERIYSLSTNTNRPTQAIYYSSGTVMNYSSAGQAYVPFTNIGNANLTVSSVTADNPLVAVTNFTANVAQGNLGLVTLNLNDSTSPVTTTLHINTNVGQKNITIQYSGVGNNDLIVDIKPDLHASLYPNPFQSQSTITLESAQKMDEPLQMKVFNVKGQLVQEKNIQANHQNFININLTNQDNNGHSLQSGIYFYQIKSQQNSVFGKFMIIR